VWVEELNEQCWCGWKYLLIVVKFYGYFEGFLKVLAKFKKSKKIMQKSDLKFENNPFKNHSTAHVSTPRSNHYKFSIPPRRHKARPEIH
jgi:hypothetical protein